MIGPPDCEYRGIRTSRICACRAFFVAALRSNRQLERGQYCFERAEVVRVVLVEVQELEKE